MGTNKKAVGVIISMIVVLGVVFATVFLGRKPATTPSLDLLGTPLLNQGGDGGGNSPVSQTPPVKTSKSSSGMMPTVSQMPPVDMMKRYVYKDGSYSATGSYMSPGGLDKLGVMLTIKDDLITDINLTPEPGDNTSARYQDKFISGYRVYVLGKNIADVQLTKVSGSSLTPKGFNDALAQIKSQAKA